MNLERVSPAGSADDLAALGVEGKADGLADSQAARVVDHAAVQVEDLAGAGRVAEGVAGDGPQGVVGANGVDRQVARGIMILLLLGSAQGTEWGFPLSPPRGRGRTAGEARRGGGGGPDHQGRVEVLDRGDPDRLAHEEP